MVWKRGERLASRSSGSASSSRSSGRSGWAKAPCTRSRTPRRKTRNAGLPARLARSASVLMKKPTVPSVSSVRPVTGVPTTTSSSPASRPSSSCHRDSSIMNGVAPSCRARAHRRSRTAGSRRDTRDVPAPVGTAGRGRSAGSSSVPAVPSICPRHQASWRSISPPSSISRCHRAKSANCTGGGPRGEGKARGKRLVQGPQLLALSPRTTPRPPRRGASPGRGCGRPGPAAGACRERGGRRP